MKSVSEFLQALFIAHAAYLLAYNKWIREQVVDGLGLPDLYRHLPAIISVGNIIGAEFDSRAEDLRHLCDEWLR
jgi:hypothetical protein